ALAPPNTAGISELQHKQSKNLSAPPRGQCSVLIDTDENFYLNGAACSSLSAMGCQDSNPPITYI
ncbi:hypothetical protein, partial [Rhizobium rhizogenes]|uniref:hypothetical protein n=1 Tax=Rhizobium rhizogenes TaxID=359 RepID=UPI001AED2E44